MSTLSTTLKVLRIITDLTRDASGYLPLGPEPRYRTAVLDDPAEIDRGRRLQTELYVGLGKIDPETIGPDGIPVADPFHEVSTYMATYLDDPSAPDRRGGMLAFGRFIWSPDITASGLRVTPDRVGPDYAEKLATMAPGTVGEGGAFAKFRGAPTFAVLKLHRDMLTFAMANGCRWVVGCLEPPVYPLYKMLSGPGLIRMSPGPRRFEGIENALLPVLIDTEYRVHLSDLRIGAGNPAMAALRHLMIAYGLLNIDTMRAIPHAPHVRVTRAPS